MLQLPDNSPQVWHRFFKENKVVVHRFIVREIKKAIEKDLDRVDLFKFKNGHVTYVKREDYLFSLDEAIKAFVAEEMYELAKEAKTVIDSYHINQLLKEVSNGV